MNMTSPKKQFKNLRSTSAPRSEFKKELWSELDSAWNGFYPQSSGFGWKRMVAIPLAALVLFFTTGAGVYAYASPNVTEDTPLYPVKRGIENVEGQFMISPEAKSQFHARMLERRINEAEVRIHRGMIPEDRLIELSDELNISVEDLEEAKDDDELRDEIREEIVDHLEEQKDRIHLLFDGSREFDYEHDKDESEHDDRKERDEDDSRDHDEDDGDDHEDEDHDD